MREYVSRCRRAGDTRPLTVLLSEVVSNVTARELLRGTPANEIDRPALRLYENLTKRELEVLRGIADGEKQEQTALRLHLSVHTLKTYRARTREKLGAHTTAHAVAIAFRLGILE